MLSVLQGGMLGHVLINKLVHIITITFLCFILSSMYMQKENPLLRRLVFFNIFAYHCNFYQFVKKSFQFYLGGAYWATNNYISIILYPYI